MAFRRGGLGAALLALSLTRPAIAAGGDEWRTRSIYQVVTDRFARSDGSTSAPCDTSKQQYCGGTWQGLIDRLDYIQGMGFDAVWISPVTDQLDGDTPDGTSYHGYWQQDLYDVNSAFGSKSDLQNLAAALHSRSMYLMVDIVTNHVAFDGAPSSITYDSFSPFDKQSYYHDYCPIDFNDAKNTTNMQLCWEGSENVPLPDLRTEDKNVRDMFAHWISVLTSQYSIDGLRIDSVLEVEPDFWSGFLSAAGVYAVGEVYNGDAAYIGKYQDYMPGILNYGTYFPLIRAFQNSSGSLDDFASAFQFTQSSSADPTLLGTFSENHDSPRFASLTPDLALAKNVLAFTLLTDGIPIVYQGQEQHFAGVGGGNSPYNREALWLSGYDTSAPLYEHTAKLNAARKLALNHDTSYATARTRVAYHDSQHIALAKGDMWAVLTNVGGGSSENYNLTLEGAQPGWWYTDLLSCMVIVADGSGNMAVPMAAGAPRVLYSTAALAGTQFCNGGSSSSSKTRRFRPREASEYWARLMA